MISAFCFIPGGGGGREGEAEEEEEGGGAEEAVVGEIRGGEVSPSHINLPHFLKKTFEFQSFRLCDERDHPSARGRGSGLPQGLQRHFWRLHQQGGVGPSSRWHGRLGMGKSTMRA